MSGPGFQNPLLFQVQILINGVWNDISQYVYQRDGFQITGGKQEEGDTAQPAQLTCTLDNRDGSFSPNNASGQFYPYLQRNVKIQAAVTVTSSTGNFYSGFRFTGKVAEWPPEGDISQQDIFVQITANGPLRQVNQGGGKGSALTRYYNVLDAPYTPIAYWPCEEDPDANILGAGIEGGQDMQVTAGTPLFKAVSDFNGSAPIAVINKSTWTANTGSFGASGDDVFTTPGPGQWVSPITGNVTVKLKGPGGGGQGGNTGSQGGGGGESASTTTMPVTAGTTYNFYVGVPGNGGFPTTSTSADGGDGDFTWFTGDSGTTIQANGGKGGGTNGGIGGTGSTAPTHFNGGNGFNVASSGGGGSSAGDSAAGNNATSNIGASAPAGGGHGGDGYGTVNIRAAQIPGGGGGGGRVGGVGAPFGFAGFAGAPGKVEIIYSAPSQANTNVIRWIMKIPSWGGNPGKVLLNAETGGTVKSVRVKYQKGGKLELIGYSGTAGTGSVLFDSGNITINADGQTIMCSIELQNSGANIAWTFRTIIPGNKSLNSSTTGTLTTASCGNVTSVTVSPNADITKTALGHISVQYALIALTKVSNALNGHDQELGIDRFLRLADEEALGAQVEFNEGADHWGFETATPNFLTGDNSTFDTSIGTWTGAGNDSIGRVTTPVHSGAGALRLISTAAGDMAAAHCTAANILTQGLACTPGNQIRVTAWFRATTTARNVETAVDFYTSAGAFVSTLTGPPVTNTTTGWVLATCQLIAPATAAFCRANVKVLATGAASEAHIVDDVYLANMSTGAGIQSWVPTNGSLAQSPTAVNGSWPSVGSWSLLLTAAGGAGQWFASAPGGLNGQPVNIGDTVSAAADCYTPTVLGAVQITINWYTSGGTYISTSAGPTYASAAGEVFTVSVSAQAPANAAFFNVNVADNETVAANTLLYIDNVRVHPRMGVQTTKALSDFMKEIETLDQGILKEARELWGMKYRTRIRLINQSPAVTLDYNQQHLADVLKPVVDDFKTKNDITVKRHKGSKVRVTLTQGSMSVQEPPNGVGRASKRVKVVAAADQQLAALAAQLLALGTTSDERYPTVTVELARAEVANMLAALASVEIGDMIQIINLPFWYPNATAKQLVIGYTESITPFNWQITWNCIPYAPYIQVATSLRRW